MGSFEAFNFATGRAYCNFDLALGSVDLVVEEVQKLESSPELHVPTPMNPDMVPHFADAKVDMLTDLEKAKELIEEARQLTLSVVIDLP